MKIKNYIYLIATILFINMLIPILTNMFIYGRFIPVNMDSKDWLLYISTVTGGLSSIIVTVIAIFYANKSSIDAVTIERKMSCIPYFSIKISNTDAEENKKGINYSVYTKASTTINNLKCLGKIENPSLIKYLCIQNVTDNLAVNVSIHFILKKVKSTEIKEHKEKFSLICPFDRIYFIFDNIEQKYATYCINDDWYIKYVLIDCKTIMNENIIFELNVIEHCDNSEDVSEKCYIKNKNDKRIISSSYTQRQHKTLPNSN